MKKLMIVMLALGLAGCATKPIATKDAQEVPENRILDKSLIGNASRESGNVVIKRDSGAFGGACFARIYIDGKELADLDSSEKVVIYPSIGPHIFSAWPKGMCGGGMSEVSSDVQNGKTLLYRVGYGSNGDFGIYPTAF